MTKDELIELINHTVYENEDGDITGEVMNLVLNAIVATIGVEANPDDEATGTLNKIKIGEEVFNVEGGGGTVDPYPTEDSTNPVQSGGVYEALGNLYTALAVAGNCLFGGYVEPNDEPIFGDDHRYYYLAATEGRYTHFYNFEVDNYIAMFLWNENTQHWRMLTLWPNDQTVTEWLENKANIVYNATAGHLAGLDEYGNPTDSGIAASDVATTSDLAGKQDVISDLATIRSGAAAGATAYQKPSGGIPKTDLASGVQTSLGKADTAFQKPSGGIPASDLAAAVQTSLGKADTAVQTESDPVFSASPAADITSGDISDWDGKAEPIEIVDASTPPMTMQPDKVYQYGTLSGDTTFPLLLFINDGKAHIHCWTFATPATAPTITWPNAITSWAGGSAPTINASKSYEVSVMDGLATIIEA